MNSNSFYKNSSPITMLSTFPQILLETIQIMLAKLIQLVQQLTSTQILKQKQTPQRNSGVINIYERKNAPPLRKAESNCMVSLKNDFQSLQSRLIEFKTSSSFDKKALQSSPPAFNNSFQYEEMELKLIKVQQSLKRDVDEVKGRLTTIQEDIGQILLLYKDLIFDR